MQTTSRLGLVKALHNKNVTIFDGLSKDVFVDNLPQKFVDALTESILNGEDGDSLAELECMPERAKAFLHKPDTLPSNINSTYGPKIARQLPHIVAELNRDNSTRRASMQILQEQDLLLLGNDALSNVEFSCTLSYNFSVLQGKLHMTAIMRSQNIRLFLLDCHIQNALAKKVADATNCSLGDHHIYMLNLHKYQNA